MEGLGNDGTAETSESKEQRQMTRVENRGTGFGYLIIALSMLILKLESDGGTVTGLAMMGIQVCASSVYLPRCNILVLYRGSMDSK